MMLEDQWLQADCTKLGEVRLNKAREVFKEGIQPFYLTKTKTNESNMQC